MSQRVALNIVKQRVQRQLFDPRAIQERNRKRKRMKNLPHQRETHLSKLKLKAIKAALDYSRAGRPAAFAKIRPVQELAPLTFPLSSPLFQHLTAKETSSPPPIATAALATHPAAHFRARSGHRPFSTPSCVFSSMRENRCGPRFHTLVPPLSPGAGLASGGEGFGVAASTPPAAVVVVRRRDRRCGFGGDGARRL